MKNSKFKIKKGRPQFPELFGKPPTLSAIIKSLQAERKMYQESYRELDGVVRNEGARHTMDCLASAEMILRFFRQKGAR